MSCPQCRGLEAVFDDKTAQKDLKSYRKNGPDKTTHMLIEALKAQPIDEASLLDIGGGVGAIQHELLTAGVERGTNVDASAAYLSTARHEAERQRYQERMTYHHGNFVDLAPQLEAADIVTLDRAICCYPDMPALVGLSADRAEKLYGLVFPRDAWWMKIAITAINFFTWLLRKEVRFFVHPTEAVENLLRGKGFQRTFYRTTFFWQVAVYTR